jgi:hypothetical protein
MRIHITTTATEQAAREIMRHMESHGGEWIVNAVEDEGYVIAKVGTLEGKRLSRSFSPSLCGPFSFNTTLDELEGRLRIARRISLGVKSDSARRDTPKPAHDDGWESPTHATLKLLKQRNITVAELRKELKLSRSGAHSVMARLVASNRARVVMRLPASSGGNFNVYGAVS